MGRPCTARTLRATFRLCSPEEPLGTPLPNAPKFRSPKGNVCPARAWPATFLLTIPTSAPDFPSRGEAPRVDHVALHTFPCILGDPQTKRDKIRSDCLTPAFSGAHKRAEVLCNPCIFRGPQTKGDKIRSSCLTLAFSGAHKKAEMLCNPCILGDPRTKGDKIRSGCLTPAFPGAQKRAEMLRHPYILRGSPNKGGQSKVAASTLPSRGPKRGQKCYVTPAFSGVPKQRGQNRKSTYARGHNDVPSILKYGSLVRPDAQIVALR